MSTAAPGSALRRRKPAAPPAERETVVEDSPGVKARIDALNRKLRAAEVRAGEAETVAAENARLRANLVMRTSDRPGLRDPEVCDFLVERYQATTAKDGDKAPTFDAWFASQLEKPSPLLAPYLAKPEPPKVETPAPGTRPKPPPVPNPNAGAAGGIPEGSREFTDEETNGWDDETWRQNSRAVEAQLVAAGKIRPLKKPAAG